MEIVLQYFEGCTQWRLAEERLGVALARLGDRDVRLSHRLVDGQADAEQLRFCGSPTILIDGRDPFAEPSAPVTLACRIYRTPDGLQGAPTVEQLAEVIRSEETGT